MRGVGLDIGTNMLVSATMNEEGTTIFKKQRDAFFRITPKSEVNKKSIRKALDGRSANFIMDGNDFIVVGEDALHMANERNQEVLRPMSKGVLSPKEKEALPIIKLIIKSLVGSTESNDSLVFSVPAEPVDGKFDIFYHTEMMKSYLKNLGYKPSSVTEGFAIAFSELLDDNLTGMCLSFGAGMINTAVCYEGDPVVEFALTKGGDWIDTSVATALDLNPSLIQLEKELSNLDLLSPSGKIQEAICVYYGVLLNYAVETIAFELKQAKLPAFREPISVVLSGGLALANNFKAKFTDAVSNVNLPFEIKEVKMAEDPLTCVARGCLMASIL
jgi:actin-like ATPase involved in cell morphogenesis